MTVPEIKSQRAYSGSLQIEFHLDYYKQPFDYFTLNKLYLTAEPLNNFNMGITFTLDEARQLSAWLQEILLKVEDIQ